MSSARTSAPVSRITLSRASPQATFISEISSASSSQLPPQQSPRLNTMSTSLAPSLTAKAVSAVLISTKVCDEGKLPATTAVSTPLTSSAPLTTTAKLGQVQMAATLGSSGYSSSKALTRSTIFVMLSTVSVELSLVRSIALKQVLQTSTLLFSSKCFAKMSATAAVTAASSPLTLLSLSTCRYLSWMFSDIIL